MRRKGLRMQREWAFERQPCEKDWQVWWRKEPQVWIQMCLYGLPDIKLSKADNGMSLSLLGRDSEQ